MSWLTGNGETSREARLKGLAEGLLALDAEPLPEQSRWWMQVAQGLDAERLQPHSIAVDYDTLGRYFDGTILGMTFNVRRVAGERDELTREDLGDLLTGHFGFCPGRSREELLNDANFGELCQKLFQGGRTVSKESVFYAVRRLRLGALLSAGHHFTDKVYHYSYSGEQIQGSWVPCSGTEQHYGQRGWQRLATVAAQKPCGECGSLAEYVFSDPASWEDRIHWVHAHQPNTGVLLALGQQHQLRSHLQGVLCRLQGVSPQLEIAGTDEEKLPNVPASPGWSSVVFPALFVDEAASRSLQRYRAWRSQDAKATPRGIPPAVSVGVVHQNLAVLWTSSNEKTVVSVTSPAAYLGRWNSGVPQHSKSMESLLARCWCCHRPKGDGYGYEQLPQEDCTGGDIEASDEGTLLSEEVEQAIRELEVTADAENSANFELNFREILVQLGEANSILRMGNHVQLAFRLILNGTSQCLDVMALYIAAISRIQMLLYEKTQPQKDALISKISTAKLELSAMLRMVEPFAEQVLPQLRAEVLSTVATTVDEALPAHKALHHMSDADNNLREFLRDCRSQIQLCESLINEYHLRASDKVNNILNFLTIITFLVMPLQLLTGVYGMNFQRMPELRWEYGYGYFFGLATSLTIVFALSLVCIYRVMV